MRHGNRKIRFGLWYDFRNPQQWRQSSDRLYREILDQIAWGENNGFDDVWLSEHHFIEDGYLASILPVASPRPPITLSIRPTIIRHGYPRRDFSPFPRICAIANNCGKAAFSRSSTPTPR
jgi:hypothetical protein